MIAYLRKIKIKLAKRKAIKSLVPQYKSVQDAFSAEAIKKARDSAKRPSILFVRFPIKEQVHFAKRLSFLVGAGVSILESLHLMRKQTRSRGKRRVYDQVIDDVTNGLFLSTSLARFERLFGSFAINLIKIGETGGMLTENLNYLAEELKKKEELRKRVMGALIYPIFITIATLMLSGMLVVFIFPKIMPIFQSLSVELPFSTLALLWLSKFLAVYGLYLLAGIIIFVILFGILMRRVTGFKFVVDRFVLYLPIVGRLTKGYYMTNFCRTLGLLLKSGTNVVEAISITGDTLGNLVYQRECKKMSEQVMRGERISTYLEARPFLFPDIIAHLVAVGEQTGNLSDTLLYLSDMYEAEVSDATKNLSNSIEPILMLVMGFIVGFVAVSVITPIYEVTQYLQP